jgi:hypothetical protein
VLEGVETGQPISHGMGFCQHGIEKTTFDMISASVEVGSMWDRVKYEIFLLQVKIKSTKRVGLKIFRQTLVWKPL